MALNEIFKPKWQHRDPTVRKQAVEGLTEQNDLETLQLIAREDSEPSVRCLAVRKISDVSILRDIAQEADSNWEVRQLAQQRYHQIIGGLKEEAPDLETRLGHFNSVDDVALTEFLARQAKEPELREAALVKIDAESVLVEIVTHESVFELRSKALEKINDQSLLEQLAKNLRGRDKRTYRVIAQRLETMTQTDAPAEHAPSEAETLCKRLELLNKVGEQGKNRTTFEQIEQQWAELAEPANEEIKERYERARDYFLIELATWEQAEAANAELREKHKTLFDALQTMFNQLETQQTLSVEATKQLQKEAADLEKQWKALDKLPEAEEQQQQNDFHHLLSDLKSRQTALLHHRSIYDAMHQVCKESERLVQRNRALQSIDIKQLEQKWQAIEHPPAAAELIKELIPRFDKAIKTLRERHKTQQENREENLEALKKSLDVMEKALEDGQLHTAAPLEKECRELLNNLAFLPKAQHAEFEVRVQDATARIRELESWQRWGNQREREQLCELVEGLIGATEKDDLEGIARQIREAQAAWKKLSAGDNSNALWKRFNEACQKAYEPCNKHFEQKAAERQANLEAKEAVCEKLESYVAETDWQHLENADDWKSAHRFLQKQIKAWRNIGPTDRKTKKAISKRFDDAIAAFDDKLDRERGRNFRTRQALLTELQALAGSEDVHQAVKEAKRLQAEWRITVPSARKDENQLWKDFRTAGDVIFEQRKKLFSEQDQARQENLSRKVALCEQLEQFAADEDSDFSNAGGLLNKITTEWDAVGEVPRKDVKDIERRFNRAVKGVEQARSEFQARRQKAQVELLAKKAALCIQLESRINDEEVENLRTAWGELEALPDKKTESKINQRFETAAVAAPDEEAFEKAVEIRAILCIRMEILAGIESPPEAREARLNYQVERLSQAMGNREQANIDKPEREARKIETEWHVTGPVKTDDALIARFTKARDAFYQATSNNKS